MKKTNLFLSFCREGVAGVMVLWVMLAFSVGAWAQSYYVIYDGTNYLGVSSTGAVADYTDFDPQYCVWVCDEGLSSSSSRSLYVALGSTKHYLVTNQDAGHEVSTQTSSWNNWRLYNGRRLYYYWTTGGMFNRNTYSAYLYRRGGSWRTSTTEKADNDNAYKSNNGNFDYRPTVYEVNLIDNPATLSSITIQAGTDRMDAVGSSSFTHTDASYTRQRTNYQFNGEDHIYYGPDETVSYYWTLSDMDGYASVGDDGEVAYSTLVPERERTATLTCTAYAGDLTQTATTTITFVNPDVLFDPVIAYQNDGATNVQVTLSYPEIDNQVHLYYTTDGSDPSSEGTQYTVPFTVSSGTTIKVVAVKNQQTSNVVEATVLWIAPPTEVGVSVVTLNDLEDHNWTYYQSTDNLPAGYPSYLSSPDPRNVRITYQGGGVDGASAVAISGLAGEEQNEMVYYKTLEKTVLGMTGDYPYQVISNPFSKRPRTNGSTGNEGYFGFAGWKVISGGGYIQEYADNDVIPLDAIIHFTNLDTNYTPNCISGAIVLKATWTAATVKTGTTAQTFEGGTYETNFWVITGNINGVTVNSPCTVTMISPDGGASVDNRGTCTISGVVTPGTDNVKVEFVRMNTTTATSAVSFTYTMGRGIIASGNDKYTGGDLQGVSSDKASVHTVKIESGKFQSLHNFASGVTNGKAIDQLFILGCDYDRAKGDNAKLSIEGNMYLAQSKNLTRATGQLYCRTIIKSGDFQTNVDAINSSYAGSGGSQTYYFSVQGDHYPGRRYLVVEGGHLRGIAGGMDDNNDQSTTERSFDLRVRGTAQIDGVVYGAAEYVGARGTRTMVFTGGTVNGWIAGGANGTQSSGGLLNGASYLYIGGNTRVETVAGNRTRVLNRGVGGNVFGAGCGYSTTSTSGEVRLGTNVVVADNSYVERGVYGGGSYGFCGINLTSNIFITGGHVGGADGGVNGTTYSAAITGGVFGGACQNKGGGANIVMTGGLVEGGIYGGSNANGTMSRSVTMRIDGGQVGTSEASANIHGAAMAKILL